MDSDDQSIPSESLGIARLAAAIPPGGAILLAHSEAQAARLFGAAQALAAHIDPTHLPAWDCLPFDRASPSHAAMGGRMAALRRIRSGAPRLVIASPEAIAQRLPRVGATAALHLRPGDPIGRDAIDATLTRFGFTEADEAEAPGERALHPSVIDVFPADGTAPVRIRLDGDRIEALERIDPRTRRSRRAIDELTLGPASELVLDEHEPPALRDQGVEHRLPELRGPLADLFELMPDATLFLDEDAEDSLAAHLAAIRDAYDTRATLARSGRVCMPVDGLYLDTAAWSRIRATRRAETIAWPRVPPLPRLLGAPDAAARLLAQAAAAGRRVAISGARLARALDTDLDPVPVADWPSLLATEPGAIALLPDGIPAGFDDPGQALILSTDDVLPPPSAAVDASSLFSVPLAPGDTAIHLDHGLGRIERLETVQTDHGSTDCLVLGFAGDARKLVPCVEMDRVWRYGAADETASLDRADGSTWTRRCGPVVLEIQATAQRLVAEAVARRDIPAPVIKPNPRRMARFIAGFPFAPTRDQDAAFAAIAADIASGVPMNRLLCGEAGFGKTEVALRAAAATALCGHQVAILAPTTVLVRQHLETFRRRLAAIGIEVAALSRLTSRPDATRIKRRLADGTLPVVVGTQSLATDGIAFRNLALVIVDEEQRFGTEDKQSLARLRDGAHTLSMSATPIPRTLERALAGLEEISILATPPARRLPIRTEILDLDEAVVATALRREHARGGQSFVIAPRIRDLDEVAALIDRLAPDLSVVSLHGRMKPDALDAALVGFADGHGDVLLATNIIEAGLDIPRANTLLVFNAERFGLAQLHQIRGRVGRGRVRGHAFLFRSTGRKAGKAALSRLDALAAHEGLGAGFAIAGQDLDQRGGGDLLGDEQAGHAKLLGLELARHLTARAIEAIRGDADTTEDWRPEITLSIPSTIPDDYVPDETARLALHARIARPHSAHALSEELEDRFGPVPDSLRLLLAGAEIRQACHRLGVARLEAGPAGAAATLRGQADAPEIEGLEHKGRRLLLRRQTTTAADRIAAARQLLRLLAPTLRASAPKPP